MTTVGESLETCLALPASGIPARPAARAGTLAHRTTSTSFGESR